jgi:hypothetical protein
MGRGFGFLAYCSLGDRLCATSKSEDRDMAIGKSLTASFVLGIIVTIAPSVQAAGFTISQPQTENLVQVVKMHHHAHHMNHTRDHHPMMGKGPGRCGENMYFKKGHCMDARDKS